LYAAIQAGLVPKQTIANAYNNPQLTPRGDGMPGFTVQQALGALSTSRGLGGLVQGTKTAPVVPPRPGDIIFEPDEDPATNEDTMHHVFVITELSTSGDFLDHTVS
jgi:hypothetical protein